MAVTGKSMSPFLRAKVDTNHPEIVSALRTHPNVTVCSLAALGGGVPDLMIGCCGVTVLAEIKYEKEKLNPMQTRWHKAWRGTPVVVLRDVGSAHQLIANIQKARQVFGTFHTGIE